MRTAKKYQRPDGSVVAFEDNACVLITKAGEPIGTRLSGKYLVALVVEDVGGEGERDRGPNGLIRDRCRGIGVEEDEMVENFIVGSYACVGIGKGFHDTVAWHGKALKVMDIMNIVLHCSRKFPSRTLPRVNVPPFPNFLYAPSHPERHSS